MKERLQRFMADRYGVDEFGRVLNILVLVLLLLSIFLPGFFILASAGLIYEYMRVFSKKAYKRREENAAYLRLRASVKGWFALRKKHMQERRTHHFYKCPECKQKLRVPRGKGKVRVSCPKCHKQFEKVA